MRGSRIVILIMVMVFLSGCQNGQNERAQINSETLDTETDYQKAIVDYLSNKHGDISNFRLNEIKEPEPSDSFVMFTYMKDNKLFEGVAYFHNNSKGQNSTLVTLEETKSDSETVVTTMHLVGELKDDPIGRNFRVVSGIANDKKIKFIALNFSNHKNELFYLSDSKRTYLSVLINEKAFLTKIIGMDKNQSQVFLRELK